MKIAVVEESRSQAAILKALLKGEGYEVEVFADGSSCLDALKLGIFDFFIISWTVPDIGGDELLRYIREHSGWDVPVMICAARYEEEAFADILLLGADDVVAKPIRYMELMARIKVLLRRSQRMNSPVLHIGNFLIDLPGRRIRLVGKDIDLTQREFDLAAKFFLNVGRIISREELLSSIWTTNGSADSRTVDTHASRLRKKLCLGGEHGLVLSSVYGQGYRLDTVQMLDS